MHNYSITCSDVLSGSCSQLHNHSESLADSPTRALTTQTHTHTRTDTDRCVQMASRWYTMVGELRCARRSRPGAWRIRLSDAPVRNSFKLRPIALLGYNLTPVRAPSYPFALARSAFPPNELNQDFSFTRLLQVRLLRPSLTLPRINTISTLAY